MTVVGRTIRVDLATNGAGALISTPAEIERAVKANVRASWLVLATSGGGVLPPGAETEILSPIQDVAVVGEPVLQGVVSLVADRFLAPVTTGTFLNRFDVLPLDPGEAELAPAFGVAINDADTFETAWGQEPYYTRFEMAAAPPYTNASTARLGYAVFGVADNLPASQLMATRNFATDVFTDGVAFAGTSAHHLLVNVNIPLGAGDAAGSFLVTYVGGTISRTVGDLADAPAGSQMLLVVGGGNPDIADISTVSEPVAIGAGAITLYGINGASGANQPIDVFEKFEVSWVMALT